MDGDSCARVNLESALWTRSWRLRRRGVPRQSFHPNPAPRQVEVRPGDFLQPRNDEKRPGGRVGRILRTVAAVKGEFRIQRLPTMKIPPSTIEDNLYPFIFCNLPRQVLK